MEKVFTRGELIITTAKELVLKFYQGGLLPTQVDTDFLSRFDTAFKAITKTVTE